jgi:hypothetical protein
MKKIKLKSCALCVSELKCSRVGLMEETSIEAVLSFASFVHSSLAMDKV